MSNLSGCTLSPKGPQCLGHACQLNGRRGGFRGGDEFADSEVIVSFGKTVDCLLS